MSNKKLLRIWICQKNHAIFVASKFKKIFLGKQRYIVKKDK